MYGIKAAASLMYGMIAYAPLYIVFQVSHNPFAFPKISSPFSNPCLIFCPKPSKKLGLKVCKKPII